MEKIFKNKKNAIIFLVLFFVVVAFIAFLFFQKGDKGIFQNGKDEIVAGKYDAFASCLASKNLTMYGAFWCSHCKSQKKLFGDSFRLVPYVECTENPNLCLDKGVSGYPTWIDEGGNKYVGEQSLEKLAEISGCPFLAE